MMDSVVAPLVGETLAKVLQLVLGDGLFAVGVPLMLEWAKRSNRVPWIDRYSGKALKVSTAIGAALVAAGIKSTLDLQAGTYVVTGLTVANLGTFGGEVVRQLGLQEIAYAWFIERRQG